MKQYHEKTAANYCKRDWSDEEVDELANLALKYSIGSYVPYNYCKYFLLIRDNYNLDYAF